MRLELQGDNVLNEVEKNIISALRTNARTSLSAIASKHAIALSTLSYTMQKLEQKKLLSHKSHVDFEKLGYALRTFMTLKTDKGCKAMLQEFITNTPNINTAHIINSGYDFHIEAVFRNKKEIQKFMESMEQQFPIIEKHEYHVVDTIRKEHFLSDVEHFS